MIPFEKALELVLENPRLSHTEYTDLIGSAGRVLAEDVKSDTDMPPFDRSAVDGFACRRIDLENDLDVIETVPAGKVPLQKIGPYQCTRIMTGGMVPKGADCVIMVEETGNSGNDRIRFTGIKTKVNIAKKAEDVKAGDIAIIKGTRIAPQHIAVMAAVGWTKPLVYKKLSVGIISTGDEIVEPEITPSLSQIRNSNAWQLNAQVRRAGASPEYYGIVGDNKTETQDIISTAMENTDVVLLTGGVSMGDFDYVPEVLRQLDIQLVFESVAIQPGRPTIFGMKGGKYIFGLPGNPVSSYVVFEILVRPMLNKMTGMNVPYKNLRLPMGIIYERKHSSRMQWPPIMIRDGEVYPLEFHGSGHIHSLVNADGIAAIPIGVNHLDKGEMVDVRQI